MGNWAEEINSKIDSKLAEVREKDIRFFRIEEFKRNVARADDFSPNCSFCKSQKINVFETVETIDEAVQVPGKTRREFDRLISRLSKHMQKEHGFYAPYYFSYQYSFYGIIVGFIIGFLLMKVIPQYSIEMLSLGFIAGLIPSYIWGFIKDNKIRSEKRLM
ncbi:MAG: hypothetical protein L3J11_11285 [Draconibacterium sp.]|nr:hypothetical protein [Draconibacterium sp.]